MTPLDLFSHHFDAAGASKHAFSAKLTGRHHAGILDRKLRLYRPESREAVSEDPEITEIIG